MEWIELGTQIAMNEALTTSVYNKTHSSSNIMPSDIVHQTGEIPRKTKAIRITKHVGSNCLWGAVTKNN